MARTIAATINWIAYIWLIAGEVFERALDPTRGRLLNRRNSAMRLKPRSREVTFPLRHHPSLQK